MSEADANAQITQWQQQIAQTKQQVQQKAVQAEDKAATGVSRAALYFCSASARGHRSHGWRRLRITQTDHAAHHS